MLSKLLTALLFIPLTLAAESENLQNPTQVSTLSQESAHPISNVPASNPPSSAVSAILNSAGTATNTPTLITGPLPPSATATNFSITLQSTDSKGNVVSATSNESVPSGYSASVSVPTGPVGGGSGGSITGGTDAGRSSATATGSSAKASSTGAAGRFAWDGSGVVFGAVGLVMALL